MDDADHQHPSTELHVSRGATDAAYQYYATGGSMPSDDTIRTGAAEGAGEEEEDEEPPKKWYEKLKPAPCPWSPGAYLRLGFVVLILAALGVGLYFNKEVADFAAPPSKTRPDGGTLYKFIGDLSFWGPIVYALIYVACTVCMVPGSVLTLLAGALFLKWGNLPGLFIGFATVSVGSTIGAALAFLLGRTVLQSWVQGKVQSVTAFKAIDTAVAKRGIVMVLLLRLVPVLPFNLLNYMLAMTSTSFPAYVIGSWVGMLPGTFLYVYLGWAVVTAIGSSGDGGSAREKAIKYSLYGVGAVASIVVVVVVTYFARKEMKKAMDEAEAEKEEEGRAGGDGSVNSSSSTGAADPSKPLLG